MDIHEKRPRVCRKKHYGNGVTGKRRRERSMRRSLDLVKKDMGKLVQRRRMLKTKRFGE